jgi:translocation and assembly module TamB
MRKDLRASSGPERRKPAKSRVFLCILAGILAVAVVAGGIASVVDMAGDSVAGLAVQLVREQTGMLLSVRGVRGNPVRGYTFEGISLASEAGRPVFSAETLGLKINFLSLLRAAPRLSLLSVGGVDMDLDRFIEEAGKIQFAESSGGGEIPIDRVHLQDSRFTSKWGEVAVTDIGAKLRGASIGLSVDGAVNGIPVKGALDLDIEAERADVNGADLSVGRGTFTAAGSANFARAGGTLLDFQGSLRDLDVSEICAFWPAFLSSEDYDGSVNSDFSVEGAGSGILITAGLDFKGSRLGGYPVEALSVQAKYSDMRLSADSVKATSMGIPIEGSIALAMHASEPPTVMVKLNGSGAPLSELAKRYPALGKVDGKVERFAIDIHGPTNALSGTVELAAPSVVLAGKRVENLAVQVKLAKSDSAAVSGKFVLEGSQGYIQGSVRSILTGAVLNLTANLRNLDVKKVADLIPDGRNYGLSGVLAVDLALEGKAAALAVSGKLGSPKFTAAGYTLDAPSLSFSYAKDVFTLKESGGSWNGIPIQAKGTVGPLTSKTPKVDLTAQLTLEAEKLSENLKPFVPDIDSYKLRDYNLKGKVGAGVKITGSLPSPEIDLLVSSPALSALGTVSAKNLEVTAALAGDLNKFDLNLKAASVAASGAGLQNLSASVKKDGQQIRLDGVSARSGEGTVTGGGTVALPAAGKDGAAVLNLAFDLDRLDLAPLAKSGGLSVPLTGLLSGKIAVSGTSSNPALSFTGKVPRITAAGFTLDGLTADISGNSKALKINALQAAVGGAPLSAAGSVVLDPAKADITVSGTGLDLAVLTSGIPDMKDQASGKFDLKFNLKSGTGQALTGTGSVRSDAAALFGIKLSNAVLPLSLGGNTLKLEGGTLALYEGKVAGSAAFDLGTAKFSGSLEASGVDVNALAQDASGGLGGKVTGKGNLSMKFSGGASPQLSYAGSGQFSMGEGAITGFSGLDILTRLHGVNGIRYAKVTAPLRLETNRLILAKGAAAVPPQNDPLYRSARLAEDGSVTFDKKLYFVADLNVNFQLLNALLGGAVGGAEALIKNGANIGGQIGNILESALSGGREQGKEADFRDATVKVTGTSVKPAFAVVKVGSSSKQEPAQNRQAENAAPAEPAQASEPAQTPKPEEIIRDKIIDAIIPHKPARDPEPEKTPQPPASEAPEPRSGSSDTREPQKPATPEALLEDQLRKGIDSLFKKK